MQLAQYKLEIINSILQINDEKILKQVRQILDKVKSAEVEVEEAEEQEDEEFDAKKMTFEEWNKQFDDARSLDQYLPEYGMTLGELRRMIYERERNGKEMSAEEFHEFIENLWK